MGHTFTRSIVLFLDNVSFLNGYNLFYIEMFCPFAGTVYYNYISLFYFRRSLSTFTFCFFVYLIFVPMLFFLSFFTSDSRLRLLRLMEGSLRAACQLSCCSSSSCSHLVARCVLRCALRCLLRCRAFSITLTGCVVRCIAHLQCSVAWLLTALLRYVFVLVAAVVT